MAGGVARRFSRVHIHENIPQESRGAAGREDDRRVHAVADGGDDAAADPGGGGEPADALARRTGRAVAEKMLAAADGVFSAQMSMAGSMAAFWPEVMSGRVPSVLNGVAFERSVEAALRPARRTVQANYRRLSKPS